MFPNPNITSGTSNAGKDASKAVSTFGFSSPFSNNTNTGSAGLFGRNSHQTPVTRDGFGGFGSKTSNDTTTSGASQQKNLFDNSSSQFTGFGGSPPALFDNRTSVHNIGPAPGTKIVPFQRFIEKEDNGTICRYETINFIDPYKNHSLEELRLADYMQDSQHDNGTARLSIFSGQAAQLGAHFHVPVAMPAFVPFTASVSTAEVVDARNSRLMPRRSSRDRDMIPQCEDPDPVAIIAEHFAAEARSIFRAPTPESIFDESDQPFTEALFEIGDLVNLRHEERPFPPGHQPSKIIARYFNDKGDSEDDNDDEMGLDSSQQDTWERSYSDIEEDGMGDLFGKRGWFYKLSRHFKLNGRYAPITVLWHEEDLELALDDDSSDDEDEAEETMAESVVEGKLGDQDGGCYTIEADEVLNHPDHGETTSQARHDATASTTEHE